jgi:hypothetical protein
MKIVKSYKDRNYEWDGNAWTCTDDYTRPPLVVVHELEKLLTPDERASGAEARSPWGTEGNRAAAVRWFHVTPLFLVPAIVEVGGLRCGSDLTQCHSPRRRSSREDDDLGVESLQGLAASDYVMLFTKRSPGLLYDKIRGRGVKSAAWKAYPHVRLDFSGEKCLAAAGGKVFGSRHNVGRTLRKRQQPRIGSYRSTSEIKKNDVSEIMNDVSEIMIAVDSLAERTLSLDALVEIVAFSKYDACLVQEHLRRVGKNLQTRASEKAPYADSQVNGPGAKFLRQTRELYSAIWNGNETGKAILMKALSSECFD